MLDWELSTIGHPLSDLSNLLQPFYFPTDLQGLKDVKDLPIPDAAEIMKYYCSQSKNINYPINRWEFALAFSFFRVILYQDLHMTNVIP